MGRNFEWGVYITTLLSVLSIVPRHSARLTHFLHPKLRKMNAVLIAPQLMTGPCGAQEAFPVVVCSAEVVWVCVCYAVRCVVLCCVVWCSVV